MKTKFLTRKVNKDSCNAELFRLADLNGVDLERIINDFELQHRFPKKVLKNADDVCYIREADYEGREDFREQTVFTIDGDDSRDFDDAVSVLKTKKGYVLGVHIADVSHYAPLGSALDKEAFRRGTSVYFPFGVIPMLPKQLSDHICSLKEGYDRLTLSVIIDLDFNGNVIKSRITESVINSCKRLTYKTAQKIIDGGLTEFENLNEPLKIMAELAGLLVKKRRNRGAIDFGSNEPEFVFEGERVVDVIKAERLFSHRLIEEFMVLANEVVARYCLQKKVPFVYRVHSSPPAEKLERLTAFLETLGIDFVFEESPAPMDFYNLYENAGESLKRVLTKVILRAQAKAEYRPRCDGHFGLNLEHYCHFTSPIRRYPDLTIHRIIKAVLKGENVNKFKSFVWDASAESSLRERLSEEAERKVDDFVIAQCFRARIGEQFKGVISGVTDFGVFVELDNTAEGLIRLENLPGEYVYDITSMTLSGPKVFKLGQELEISVAGVRGAKIEFNLVAD